MGHMLGADVAQPYYYLLCFGCANCVTGCAAVWREKIGSELCMLRRMCVLSHRYIGGSVLICRLTPQDSHWFFTPAAGRMGIKLDKPGFLHTVSPIGIAQQITSSANSFLLFCFGLVSALRGDHDVLTENARVLWEMHTNEFGRIAIVASMSLVPSQLFF